MPANAASYNPTASNVRFVLNAEMDRDYKKRVQSSDQSTLLGKRKCSHKHLANILEHELCFIKKSGNGGSTSKQARLPVFSNFAFEASGSNAVTANEYMFAGVAMTPLAWDAKQGVQGLALERGSLVTIVNNGDDNLNPGDVVAWFPPTSEQGVERVRGIDKDKLLARIVKDKERADNFHRSRVIGMAVSRAKKGHAVDILMGGAALMNVPDNGGGGGFRSDARPDAAAIRGRRNVAGRA